MPDSPQIADPHLKDMTLTKLILFCCLSQAAFGASLGTGEPMPAVRGKNLNEKTVELPKDIAGKPAVLAFGFSKDAGVPVRSWAAIVQKEFPNVPVFQIPVLEGVPRLFRGFAVSGIRNDTPTANREFLVLLYQDEKLWRDRLEVKDDKQAYLVVLDSQGRVARRVTGLGTDEQKQSLKTVLEALKPN